MAVTKLRIFATIDLGGETHLYGEVHVYGTEDATADRVTISAYGSNESKTIDVDFVEAAIIKEMLNESIEVPWEQLNLQISDSSGGIQ